MTAELNHQYLRERRLELGISLHAAARHLHCTTATVRSYEQHPHHPHLTLRRLGRLAELLHTTPTQLLTPTQPGTPTAELDTSGVVLSDASLRHLNDAHHGTLTPSASTNPALHIAHLTRLGLIETDNGHYRTTATITTALNQPAPVSWHRLHRQAAAHATWRQELLDALDDLEHHGHTSVTPAQLARHAQQRGSHYSYNTLRQRVTQHLAAPQPDPTRDLYNDLQRLTYGRYQRNSTATGQSSTHRRARGPVSHPDAAHG